MNLKFALILPLILCAIAGCSSRQLYDTTQAIGRDRCNDLKALPERQRCLNEPTMPYDTYKRERDKVASQP